MKTISNIEDVSVEDFIKVDQTDGPVVDRLHAAGKVVMVCTETGRFEIQTVDGIIGLGWDMDDMKIAVSKLSQKPKGWSAYMKNPHPAKQKTQVTTVKERVFNLVRDNPRKRLPGLLKLAKTDIGGSDAVLSTNIQLALLKLKRSNPIK